MTNSDFFIQAAIKKFSERINQKLNEKLDEVASAAQDAPDLLKKEFNSLKKEIIEEADKMQKESFSRNDNYSSNSDGTEVIKKTSQKLKEVKFKIEILNHKLDS